MLLKWIHNKHILSIKKQDYIIGKHIHFYSKRQLTQSRTLGKIRGGNIIVNKIPASCTGFCQNMSPLPVIVSSNFDGGNGDVTKAERSANGAVLVELTIRQEPFTEGTDKQHHKQW